MAANDNTNQLKSNNRLRPLPFMQVSSVHACTRQIRIGNRHASFCQRNSALTTNVIPVPPRYRRNALMHHAGGLPIASAYFMRVVDSAHVHVHVAHTGAR